MEGAPADAGSFGDDASGGRFLSCCEFMACCDDVAIGGTRCIYLFTTARQLRDKDPKKARFYWEFIGGVW